MPDAELDAEDRGLFDVLHLVSVRSQQFGDDVSVALTCVLLSIREPSPPAGTIPGSTL
jgi:hypothetical protein